MINDATARDLQARTRQWLGKSIDTFCPIGPWLTTADEVEPGNLELSCWVNDELRQHANTRDLTFDIRAIIATISAAALAGIRCASARSTAPIAQRS